MELSAPDYVILIVEDLDRTLDFYTQVLGLRLGHRAGEYAQMDTGTTRLGFYTRTAMAQAVGFSLKKPAPDAAGFEIGFKVPDVNAAYNELVEKGAVDVAARNAQRPGPQTSRK
jgi:catechol 2,3-dioxygenase-like lactoylglutathione lyase family enzyme